MPVFDIKTIREAIIHIVVALDDVGLCRNGILGITSRTEGSDKWGNTPTTAFSEEVLHCSHVYISHAFCDGHLDQVQFHIRHVHLHAFHRHAPVLPVGSNQSQDVKLCGRDKKRCRHGLRAHLVSGMVGVCHHLHHPLLV